MACRDTNVKLLILTEIRACWIREAVKYKLYPSDCRKPNVAHDHQTACIFLGFTTLHLMTICPSVITQIE